MTCPTLGLSIVEFDNVSFHEQLQMSRESPRQINKRQSTTSSLNNMKFEKQRSTPLPIPVRSVSSTGVDYTPRREKSQPRVTNRIKGPIKLSC